MVENRQVWLDWARSLAIISVTFNHALSKSFDTRSGTFEEYIFLGNFPSFFKALLYVFSRLGVPLFLMISGTLLLDRQYEKKEVLKRFIMHNWLQLFVATEIWLTIMFWFLQIFSDSILRTSGFIEAVKSFLLTLLFINQTTMSSMWYMPMILCLYLMIPVISVAIRKLDNRLFAGLCSLAIVCSMVIPNINTALKALKIDFKIVFEPVIDDVFSIYMIYVIIGYWISKGIISKMSDLTVSLSAFTGFVCTSLFQFWIYTTPSDYYVRYRDIGILVTSCFLFEIIRRLNPEGSKSTKPVLFVSNAALGIYFVHICIMTFVRKLMDKYADIHYFESFIILELTSFAGSLLIIWLASKNTFIKKRMFLMK